MKRIRTVELSPNENRRSMERAEAIAKSQNRKSTFADALIEFLNEIEHKKLLLRYRESRAHRRRKK